MEGVEDLSDSKLPTLPAIKKWFLLEDPAWAPKEQVSNWSFSHLHPNSSANPQVKLSATTARVMERNARQSLTFLLILDHFNSAVLKLVQPIMASSDLPAARLAAAVPVTEGAVKQAVFAIVNIGVLRTLLQAMHKEVPERFRHIFRASPFLGHNMFMSPNLRLPQRHMTPKKRSL